MKQAGTKASGWRDLGVLGPTVSKLAQRTSQMSRPEGEASSGRCRVALFPALGEAQAGAGEPDNMTSPALTGDPVTEKLLHELLQVSAQLAQRLGLTDLLVNATQAGQFAGDPARTGAGMAEWIGADADHQMGQRIDRRTVERSGAAVARLRREGDYWTILRQGMAIRLKDQIGLRYLNQLLRHPRREFLASELIVLCHPGAGVPSEKPASGLSVTAADTLAVRMDSDAGAWLDSQAVADYRGRLEDLRETVKDAERCNDPERGCRARAEIQFLSEELARAVGLRKRRRTAGSQLERARVSTTRALRKAIRNIAAHDRALGRSLATAIKTGAFCSYDPAVSVGISWEVSNPSRQDLAAA